MVNSCLVDTCVPPSSNKVHDPRLLSVIRGFHQWPNDLLHFWDHGEDDRLYALHLPGAELSALASAGTGTDTGVMQIPPPPPRAPRTCNSVWHAVCGPPQNCTTLAVLAAKLTWWDRWSASVHLGSRLPALSRSVRTCCWVRGQ